MSAACVCPDLQPIETVPSSPVRCSCCGGALRFTCDGDCGEEHVRRSFASARRAFAPVAPPGAREPKSPKTAPVCARCHMPMPKTGGRPRKFCDGCLTPAERKQLQYQNAYNDRVRAAKAASRTSATFQPGVPAS